MSEALERLIEAVEVGEWDGSWRGVLEADKMMPPQAFSDAYHGSLDAAKAVHDAILPGWPMVYLSRYGPAPHRWSAELADLGKLAREPRRTVLERGDCPARAWLLAILRAKLAENHPRQKTSE